MREARQLPALRFLREAPLGRETFRRAPWLRSAFEDEVWRCTFGGERAQIDFRIRLEDGTLLTAPRHRPFLDRLKAFLCLQTHPLCLGGRAHAAAYERRILFVAVQILDYFLVRSAQFRVARAGLSEVTGDDLACLLAAVVNGGKRIKAALYDLPGEVARYLRPHAVPARDAAAVAAAVAGMAERTATRRLPLSDEALLGARAFLWRRGLYSATNASGRCARPMGAWHYRVRMAQLLRRVYGDRVLGNLAFAPADLEDLHIGRRLPQWAELPAVPVHSEDEEDRAGAGYVGLYLRALRTMRLAAQHGFPLIPPETLATLETPNDLLPGTKPSGRFTRLPDALVEAALRHAVAFLLEYGDDLVASYLRYAAAAVRTRQRFAALDVRPSLSPGLARLRVARWRLAPGSPATFFPRLRAEPGLYELLLILYGSAVIVVNTVMARRIGELLALDEGCLCETPDGAFLRFRLKKANVGERRAMLRRPIPQIAVRAIQLLLRLRRGLDALGTVPAHGPVFAVPQAHGPGLTRATREWLYLCLNRFADYFELATDGAGRRHYLRPHQLRAYFATLFFWHYPIGDALETLRYFLGHVDPEQTYRYITDVVPGAVLTRVKAEGAAREVQRGSEAAAALRDLLARRYGVARVSIMPAADVADWIEDLLAEGQVRVEPIFFETPDGQHRYRIMITVREPGDADAPPPAG